MFAPEKPKSKSKKKQVEGDEEELEPIDVLVNCMIGYLERGTAYTRAVATKAFEPLCAALQASTVKLILSVSEPQSFLCGYIIERFELAATGAPATYRLRRGCRRRRRRDGRSRVFVGGREGR